MVSALSFNFQMEDRRELKEGYPYAYVWNCEEEFGEIGCIQIKMEQGGLVRVA